MKTVGTITEILDLFYKRLVDIMFGKFKLTIYGMLCGVVSVLLLWML